MKPPRCSNHGCLAPPEMLRWTETSLGEPVYRPFCLVCGVGRTRQRKGHRGAYWFRMKKFDEDGGVDIPCP